MLAASRGCRVHKSTQTVQVQVQSRTAPTSVRNLSGTLRTELDQVRADVRKSIQQVETWQADKTKKRQPEPILPNYFQNPTIQPTKLAEYMANLDYEFQNLEENVTDAAPRTRVLRDLGRKLRQLNDRLLEDAEERSRAVAKSTTPTKADEVNLDIKWFPQEKKDNETDKEGKDEIIDADELKPPLGDFNLALETVTIALNSIPPLTDSTIPSINEDTSLDEVFQHIAKEDVENVVAGLVPELGDANVKKLLPYAKNVYELSCLCFDPDYFWVYLNQTSKPEAFKLDTSKLDLESVEAAKLD